MTGLATLFLTLGLSAAAPPDEAHVVRSFDLLDASGTKHSAKGWAEAKAVAIFFLWSDCPASNGYAPEMIQLAKTYGEKKVVCYGVHSDPDLTAEQAAKHAKEYQLPFPILLDPTQSLARQTGATRVPTAVLLSNEGKVLYVGRIDDRYVSLGKKRAAPTRRDLKEAIDEVLAGKSPTVTKTDVIGCLLPKIDESPKRVEK